MTGTTSLGVILANHGNAMNACDGDALVGTFADDALLNGAHHEFGGTEAIVCDTRIVSLIVIRMPARADASHGRWAAASRSPQPATTAEGCRRGRRR
jgi:hypothetical protein